MANGKKTLGRGLNAIISTSSAPSSDIEKKYMEDSSERIVEIAVESIKPNPDQPRSFFDEEEINNLADSIKSVGLLQPILVRKEKEEYFIVAGERRYRAVKHLGEEKIRCIVIKANEEKNLTIALIENVQRQNLDPIEEAKAYRLLINRFKLKQNDVAEKVGKDRATIANILRLLNLPEAIQESLSSGKISQGHAKVLLSVPLEEQLKFFEQIVDKGLSVRALEAMINGSPEKTDDNVSTVTEKKKSSKEAHIKDMEHKLVQMLGTRVEIKHAGTKGRIEITYYSLEDFERIVEKFK